MPIYHFILWCCKKLHSTCSGWDLAFFKWETAVSSISKLSIGTCRFDYFVLRKSQCSQFQLLLAMFLEWNPGSFFLFPNDWFLNNFHLRIKIWILTIVLFAFLGRLEWKLEWFLSLIPKLKGRERTFFFCRRKKQLWFSRQFSYWDWNCDEKCLMKIWCVLQGLREQITLLSRIQQQQSETQQVSGLWPPTTSYCKCWQPQQIWEVGRVLFFQLCNHRGCLSRFVLSFVRKYLLLFYFTLALLLNTGPASHHHSRPCTLSKPHHIKTPL